MNEVNLLSSRIREEFCNYAIKIEIHILRLIISDLFIQAFIPFRVNIEVEINYKLISFEIPGT